MRGSVLLYREARSPAPPHEETWVGERWGEAASLREAPPPRPLSRRVAGNKLGCSCKLVRPCWVRLLSDKLGRGHGGWQSRRDHATCVVPPKASPEREGVRRASRGVHSPTPHVRGGSVSRHGLTQDQQSPPTSQAEPPMQKRTGQTPAALRERGVWGERRFSQRSGLSPQFRFFPPRLLGREREGGGFSSEKLPPSQNPLFSFSHAEI